MKSLTLPVFSLLLSTSHPALAQRWEVGAGLSTMFVTSGDVVLDGFTVHGNRRVSKRLDLVANLSRFEGHDTSRVSIVQHGKWYERTRYHLDAGMRYAFLQSPHQSLGVTTGLSLRRREDLNARALYNPVAFLGSESAISNLEAECRSTPECVSRRFYVTPAESSYPGTGLVLAYDVKRLNAGTFLDLDYTAHYGPVSATGYAGGRVYYTSESNPRVGDDQFTWHAGVRLGFLF